MEGKRERRGGEIYVLKRTGKEGKILWEGEGEFGLYGGASEGGGHLIGWLVGRQQNLHGGLCTYSSMAETLLTEVPPLLILWLSRLHC